MLAEKINGIRMRVQLEFILSMKMRYKEKGKVCLAKMKN
ncbi:MAG: hypothetical protein OP8BY_0541 [Candidatus Saccharicenans subterraneus]|uniref:Uncharacterized protein n=1 Tax=Candidatus Saccharicenans subterraneus TaxID=2508984 RepID=A0A3E2BKW1_9BACT|nr:MAG: hypothetical protein OP8BY_0541 [Candidatus Saccharicenans subterraneum]